MTHSTYISQDLPRYSQLIEVHDHAWQRRACGIVALAMLMNTPPERVDALIEEGVSIGAYQESVGWYHRGLARLAIAHGYEASNYDWSQLDTVAALECLTSTLHDGPVMASMLPTFSPSEAGHLVVLVSLDQGEALVHDPYRPTHDAVRYAVAQARFLEHWTRRIVVVRPPDTPLPLFEATALAS